MTGCPIAVARYSAETSHTVRSGPAPNARPIETSATAMIEELTGLSTDPNAAAAANLAPNEPCRWSRVEATTVAAMGVISLLMS
jgi:hypothetical protein